MVHALNVLVALNEQAAKKGAKEEGKITGIPERARFNPAAVRAYANRKWAPHELNGAEDLHAAYAKSAEEPFRKEGEPAPKAGSKG